MRLSLVLSTHQTQFEAVALTGDFEANVARIAEWGYEGVELAVRDPVLVDGEKLAALVEAYGLVVPALGTGQAWGEEGLSFTSRDDGVRAAAIARVKSHIPLAVRLNAIVIIGLIRGITPEGQDHALSMGYFADAMRSCAEEAHAHGVRFAIEPLNHYETDLIRSADEGIRFLEELGSDGVGLLLDTFHMNIEEPSMSGCVERCGSRIFHVHLADSNRWYPGAGHVDFRAVVAGLRAAGYDGWLSGEFLPLPDAATAAERAIAHMRSCLEV